MKEGRKEGMKDVEEKDLEERKKKNMEGSKIYRRQEGWMDMI